MPGPITFSELLANLAAGSPGSGDYVAGYNGDAAVGFTVDDLGGGSGGSQTLIVQTTASRTLSAADNGDVIYCTNTAGGCTITIPHSSSVALPAGFQVDVVNAATGVVQFVGATNVTVIPPAENKVAARTAYSRIRALYLGSDRWLLDGDLAVVGSSGGSGPTPGGGAMPTSANTGPTIASPPTIAGFDVNDGQVVNLSETIVNGDIWIFGGGELNLTNVRINGGLVVASETDMTIRCHGTGVAVHSTMNVSNHDSGGNLDWTNHQDVDVIMNWCWIHAPQGEPPDHTEALAAFGWPVGCQFTHCTFQQEGPYNSTATATINFHGDDAVFDDCWFTWENGIAAYYTLYVEGLNNIVRNSRIEAGLATYIYPASDPMATYSNNVDYPSGSLIGGAGGGGGFGVGEEFSTDFEDRPDGATNWLPQTGWISFDWDDGGTTNQDAWKTVLTGSTHVLYNQDLSAQLCYDSGSEGMEVEVDMWLFDPTPEKIGGIIVGVDDADPLIYIGYELAMTDTENKEMVFFRDGVTNDEFFVNTGAGIVQGQSYNLRLRYYNGVVSAFRDDVLVVEHELTTGQQARLGATHTWAGLVNYWGFNNWDTLTIRSVTEP